MFKRLRLHHPEKCKLTQSEVQDRQETRKEAWHIHGAKAEEESCRKQDRLKRHPHDKQQSIGTKKRGTGSSSCRIYLPVARRQRPEFEEIEKNDIHIVSCGNQRVHELTHEPRPQRCRSPRMACGQNIGYDGNKDLRAEFFSQDMEFAHFPDSALPKLRLCDALFLLSTSLEIARGTKSLLRHPPFQKYTSSSSTWATAR